MSENSPIIGSRRPVTADSLKEHHQHEIAKLRSVQAVTGRIVRPLGEPRELA
jgi:hypothetical protein